MFTGFIRNNATCAPIINSLYFGVTLVYRDLMNVQKNKLKLVCGSGMLHKLIFLQNCLKSFFKHKKKFSGFV